MSEGKVKITRDLSLPETQGTYFRVLCMTGKNKGTAYYLNGSRLVMGRSQKADIQVFDDKSSREHGELAKKKDTYILTDLKSSNGIIVNDIKVIQKKLSGGDKIIIGKVVFRFDIFRVSEKKHLVKKDEGEEEEIQSDDKGIGEKQNKNKKVMIYGIVLLGLYFFLF